MAERTEVTSFEARGDELISGTDDGDRWLGGENSSFLRARVELIILIPNRASWRLQLSCVPVNVNSMSQGAERVSS
jgi:hypothetical protein